MSRVSWAPFGTTPSGQTVDAFTLANPHGLTLRGITYGGIIVSLSVPDRQGRPGDVVLGHDTLEPYLDGSAYFGAIVGRYANRIAGARFTADGKQYRLAANDGLNHLHGGRRGFDRAVWRRASAAPDDVPGVTIRHTSPAGDEGYPGTLEAQVRYSLTDSNELVVDYAATTDAATPVNLTQHSYFNLAAGTREDVLGHLLRIDADLMTPVDEGLIPTGALVPVSGGPLDFRTLTPVGEHIADEDEQLRRAGGYDHNFVLRRDGPGLSHAARCVEPASGRTLDVFTTEPGLQFYSGNFLDGTVAGKGGRAYCKRAGLCLETQHFPDSPNQPAFPSTLLRPGEQYRSRTVFAFGVIG